MARRKTGKATEYQTSSGGKKAAETPADAVEDAVVADAEAAIEIAVDGADSGAEATDTTDSLGPSEMADEVLDAVPSDVVEGENSASGDEIANIFDEIPEASGDDAVTVGDKTPADDVVADAATDANIPVTEADDATAEMSADADTPKETELKPEPAVAAAPVAPPAEGGGMGFVPLVLGGLVAGGIGWAVATFGADAPPPPPAPVDNSERVDALEQGLQQLQADFADSPPPEEAVDLTAIETAQADLAALLAETSARIDAIEASAPAAAPDAPAIAGSLRDDLTALAAALDETNAAVSARIDALEARADAVITGAETAEAAAADAIRRAAVNEVTIALRNGTPFGEAAAALGDLPEAVAVGAQSGLPTTSALADEFPALSRDALRAARANGDEEGIGGLARSLLGARSIEPREGDSADAVLSRVGAAVDAGDLATAVTEAEALPPEAAAVLEDWINRVRARAAADAALQDYLEG